jgi:hypothetical protein
MWEESVRPWGEERLLKMWHNYCWLWWVTQDSNGFQNVAQFMLTVKNHTWLKLPPAQLLLTVIIYTGLKWLPKCGTITADCDKLHRTQMASKMWHNYCWLINYTGLKWLHRMWHNFCWLLWITHDWIGFSKCGTITADSGEIHRTQMASQNVAQLLLTVMNHTGLKWLLKMWHNYCWQWRITQDWNGFSKCGIIITDSCEFYRSEMASQNVTQ